MSESCRRVMVAVRTRPTDRFAHNISFDEEGKAVDIRVGKNADQLRGFINNKQEGWTFPVHAVLHDSSQELVYETCGRDLVTQLMKGYNGTLFAYGQTGAGKTYTMCGPAGDYQARGLIPRAIAQVFREVQESVEFSYKVYVSYLEIYNEMIHDLLATLSGNKTDSVTPLHIAEDDRRGVYVKGLTCQPVSNEEEALCMFFEGERNRTVGEHSLNPLSSRSHCIFTITVEAHSHSKSMSEYTVSRLHLVDLAGSDRLSKTQTSGAVEKEAMLMNRSLSFLEQVILAASDRRRDHVPFRQSKLTHFLRDSLGGNSYTVVIANIWTEVEQLQETISTLRFASRVRGMQTNPVRNTLKDPQLLLKEYEDEISSLKEELAMHNTLLEHSPVVYGSLSELEVEEIREQVQSFVNGSLTDIELVSMKQVKEVFAQFKALALSLSTKAATRDGRSQLPGAVDTVPHSSSRTQRESKIVSGPDSGSVGQTEGTGLGLGTAPAGLKHLASPAGAVKKTKTTSKTDSKAKETTLSSKSPVPPLAEEEEAAPPEISSHALRTATPPLREEAFEDFKRQRGSEINKIFLDNKATLHCKKREMAEMCVSINAIKRQIDELQRSLSGGECEGVKSGDGASGEGEVVMEEWQFSTLSQLKQLKVSYREKFNKLQSLQEEVECCGQYVSQSRSKLVEEFDKWYKTAFIGECTSDDPHTSEAAEEESKAEFGSGQDEMDKDPMSRAFYAAQLKTQKRGHGKTHNPPGQRTE